MALSPLANPDERAITVASEIQPSKTYRFDVTTGEISGMIDGVEAIRQFVRKAVATARFRFLIYDDNYGCELEDLIGQDVSIQLLETEIPRVIRESLIYDERIADVRDFSIERKRDELYVSFFVVTNLGTFNEEVTL